MFFTTNCPGFCFGTDEGGNLKTVASCEMSCYGLEPKTAAIFKDPGHPKHAYIVTVVKSDIRKFLTAPEAKEAHLTVYDVKTGEVLAHYTRAELQS